ncbi:hypothetical protein [Streptomyces sp. NPDC048385]|uniref:hypothetical protein n=1 Tax=unclassified Streptomyces TaxID=2593676 RepID=UPI00343D6BEE
MRPYPSTARALRAVRRRHDAYLRAMYRAIPRRLVLSAAEEAGTDLSPFVGTSADDLRPIQDHIAARTRHYERHWGPALEQAFRASEITTLDSVTISTA